MGFPVFATIGPILDPSYLAVIVPYFANRLLKDIADESAEVGAGAVIATLGSLYIQSRYNALANKYYRLYKDQRDFYFTDFQNNVNGEAGLLVQVFNNPLAGNGIAGTVYNPQYGNQVNEVAVFDINAFSSLWWEQRAGMYYTTPFDTGHNPLGATSAPGEPVAIDKAATIADMDTYLFRYEDHRADVYNERTWEWQNQALNFGVKQASVVQSGLATSFGFLDKATETMADFFGVQANGLGRYAGYKRGLSTTAATVGQLEQGYRFDTGVGGFTNPIRRDWQDRRPDFSRDLMYGADAGLA